jgi:hypothetical protein
MKKFLLLLLLVTSYTGWGQCDVYITPGSIQVIDHNPGISFAFEIQNDDIIPYSGGPLYMDWALSGFISGPIWEFDLNPIPILPGQSRFVSTPVFDLPLPGNVPGNWTPYAGWTGSEYTSFKLALEPLLTPGCYEWVTNEDGSLWTDLLSDGCDNPDGDNFCNDACHVELVDYNLETEELTIIPYSTYCPNITNPAWFNQYPYDDPYIFGFTLTFISDAGSININLGGQNIYASDTPITVDLGNGILSIILAPILEGINNGDFCELTLVLYNLNNTGQNINDVLPYQVIELINLCPQLRDARIPKQSTTTRTQLLTTVVVFMIFMGVLILKLITMSLLLLSMMKVAFMMCWVALTVVRSIITRSPILMTVLVNIMYLGVLIRLPQIITHSLLWMMGAVYFT